MLQRYLDSFEGYEKTSGGWPIAAKYRGQLRGDALAQAFEVLCSNHPELRGRIRTDEGGDLLYSHPDHIPELTVVQGDQDTLQLEAFRPWDPARALCNLIHIRGEHQGFVALRADHVIVDGRKLLALFAELWRIYTSIVNGTTYVEKSFASLPLSPEALLRERWHKRPIGSGDLQNDKKPADHHHSIRSSVCDIMSPRIHLSEEDTKRFLSLAAAHQLSVHALACGVILVALRDMNTLSTHAPMTCLTAVDLRDHVTPPVGVMETANLHGLHKAEVVVGPNSDPIAVGSEIKNQLDHDIACGSLLLPSEFSSARLWPSLTDLKSHLASTLVSNVGRIAKFEQPDELSIVDFLTMRPKTRRSTNRSGFGIYSYQNRITIRPTLPSNVFSHRSAREIVQRISSTISSIEPHHTELNGEVG